MSKIARIKDINKLSCRYVFETNIPDNLYLCPPYNKLAEYNVELHPSSQSYATNQFVKLKDIQPIVNAFNIECFTMIKNLMVSDDNGASLYYYGRGQYIIDTISKDVSQDYSIHISCDISEGEMNDDPDDIYFYRGLTIAFVNPSVSYHSDGEWDGYSTVVELISLDYNIDENNERYDNETFLFRKIVSDYNESNTIIDHISGKKWYEIYNTEAANTDVNIISHGFVIEIQNIPFGVAEVYNMTVRGTLRYMDGSTNDFEHNLHLYIN